MLWEDHAALVLVRDGGRLAVHDEAAGRRIGHVGVVHDAVDVGDGERPAVFLVGRGVQLVGAGYGYQGEGDGDVGGG